LASTFSIFDDREYDVIILDEACQVMEPMSILPFSRFFCSRAVLIGDPLQVGTKCAVKSLLTIGFSLHRRWKPCVNVMR
jgi:hypothetical protein